MTKFTRAKDLSDAQAMKRLQTLTNNLRDAECDLADFLCDLHDDSDKWERLTYAQLASVMGVTRQAVQQRVMRLINQSRTRRNSAALVHPGQLTLTD